MTRSSKSTGAVTNLFSLDEIAAHLLLIDTSDGSVKGALRIIPCPLPSEELTFLGSQRKDHSPPGRGRTEEQVIASIAKPQEVVRGSPDGRSVLLSGVKLGRIVVSSSLRGQGAGRFLVDSAEKWAIEALTQVPVQQGVKEVDAMIQLSGQVRARKFYDRYVLGAYAVSTIRRTVWNTWTKVNPTSSSKSRLPCARMLDSSLPYSIYFSKIHLSLPDHRWSSKAK